MMHPKRTCVRERGGGAPGSHGLVQGCTVLAMGLLKPTGSGVESFMVEAPGEKHGPTSGPNRAYEAS